MRLKMSQMKPDNILKAIKKRPSDALAFGRTELANERTLLAFLRTSIGLMGGGIGIVGFVERPLIVALGWLAIILSIPSLFWGIWRYRKIKRLMTEVGTEIFFADENPE
jgi:putative membrane protein